MNTKIYKTKDCVYCSLALKLMEMYNIKPEVINVGVDITVEDFKNMGHKMVPQIYVDDVLIGGYNQYTAYINKRRIDGI
jgi:glutaredoxin